VSAEFCADFHSEPLEQVEHGSAAQIGGTLAQAQFCVWSLRTIFRQKFEISAKIEISATIVLKVPKQVRSADLIDEKKR
jgi:hypothetical protein